MGQLIGLDLTVLPEAFRDNPKATINALRYLLVLQNVLARVLDVAPQTPVSH